MEAIKIRKKTINHGKNVSYGYSIADIIDALKIHHRSCEARFLYKNKIRGAGKYVSKLTLKKLYDAIDGGDVKTQLDIMLNVLNVVDEEPTLFNQDKAEKECFSKENTDTNNKERELSVRELIQILSDMTGCDVELKYIRKNNH